MVEILLAGTDADLYDAVILRQGGAGIQCRRDGCPGRRDHFSLRLGKVQLQTIGLGDIGSSRYRHRQYAVLAFHIALSLCQRRNDDLFNT